MTVAFERPVEDPGDRPEIDDYEIEGEIARGGMGVVYRARQRSLNRVVALKTILAGGRAGSDQIRRFRIEAESAAGLDHPNIVPIHEIGEAGGVLYFTMKLVEGGSLADRMSELGRRPKVAARLLALIARAVHHAHRCGVLHRDLKPANILIDARGEPHVTDFGLARIGGRSDGPTRTGTILGTPAYMSPEQAAGDRRLTVASDIHSLGVMLYEILTGRTPFRGRSLLDVLRKVESEIPAPPRSVRRGIDRDLETICLKSIEKDPARRYWSAAELADDLERWLDGQPIAARPATPLQRAAKWVGRHPAIATLLSTTALATALGLGGVLWQWRGALEARRAESVARREADQRAADARRATATAEAATEEARRQGLELRRTLYATDMNLARAAWEIGHIDRLAAVLDRHRPRPGDEDLRGFEWRYLRRFLPDDGLAGFGGNPGAIAVSPDGRLVASTTATGGAVVRERSTGRPLGAFEVEDPSESVCAVRFEEGSEALRMIVYRIDRDGIAATQRAIASLTKGGGTPSLASLYSALSLRTIRFDGRPATVEPFDPTGLDLSLTLPPQSMTAHSIVFGQRLFMTCGLTIRGRTLVLGGLEWQFDIDELARGDGGDLFRSMHPALVWVDLSTMEATLQSGPGQGAFGSLAFASDGRALVAYNGANRAIEVFETEGRRRRTSLRPPAPVHAIEFAPDDRTLVTAEAGGILRLWDIATGQPGRRFLAHRGSVMAVAVGPTIDAVATAGSDGLIRFWDVSIDPDHLAIPGLPGLTALTFSADGEELWAAGAEGSVGSWDARSGARRRSHDPTPASRQAISGVCDRRLLTRADDGALVVLDSADGGEVGRLAALDGTLIEARLSPDGRTLVARVAGADGARLEILDVATGRRLRVLATDALAGTGPVFSADGRSLAFEQVGEVAILDLSTGRVRPVGGVDRGLLGAMALSRDGRLLAAVRISPTDGSTAEDATEAGVVVWDTASGEEVLSVQDLPCTVSDLAFGPDDRRLALASASPRAAGGGVRLWDVASGQELLVLAGDRHGARRVAFSPDGTRLAASLATGDLLGLGGWRDQEIRIWTAP